MSKCDWREAGTVFPPTVIAILKRRIRSIAATLLFRLLKVWNYGVVGEAISRAGANDRDDSISGVLRGRPRYACRPHNFTFPATYRDAHGTVVNTLSLTCKG
jgi:hypothetical protein